MGKENGSMEERKCQNTLPCSCRNEKCPRHGRCCDCVAFHRDRGGYPNCLRENVEARLQERLAAAK